MPPQQNPAKENRYALLIGCTKYPDLQGVFSSLTGPANDVLLMQDVLVGRFSFPKDNVTILSEDGATDKLRPTRANIEYQFRRLVQLARPGDKVVILLSGHGSQQPAKEDDPENYEPDGLDEIFLPADASVAGEKKDRVINAITDNDFRLWITEIKKQGATIWIIVDACHSGTMVRGRNDEVVVRGIPAEQLISEEAMNRARKRAGKQGAISRGATEKSGLQFQDSGPELAAIYAVPATDLTIEWKFPRESQDRKYYGLLTYALCEILAQAEAPITYTELTQQIHAKYIQWDKGHYVPLVEGKDRHQEVLGVRSWPERSRIALAESNSGFTVNAGSIHGLSAGSILAVRSPAGQKDGDRVIGHVAVKKVRMFEALVEPCTFDGVPLVRSLPVGGRCTIVYRDFGLDRLKVAVAEGLGTKLSTAERSLLTNELDRLAAKKSAIVERTSPDKADWLVASNAGNVELMPLKDWETRAANKQKIAIHGKIPHDDLGRLEGRLERIHRARNLLKIAGASNAESTRGELSVEIAVELIRYKDEGDREGQIVRWDGSGITFREDDIIGFKLHNRSRFPVDVTVLHVDCEFAIQAIFPLQNTTGENRLNSKETIRTRRFKVTAESTGLEHVVVIAVKGEGSPVDFTCLAQPSLVQVREVAARGSHERRTLASPLGQLFQAGLFGEGASRGLSTGVFEEYVLRLVSWNIAQGGARQEVTRE